MDQGYGYEARLPKVGYAIMHGLALGKTALHSFYNNIILKWLADY